MLTEKNVSKYYPETDETVKGHMNQDRKNVRSKKRNEDRLKLQSIPRLKESKFMTYT